MKFLNKKVMGVSVTTLVVVAVALYVTYRMGLLNKLLKEVKKLLGMDKSPAMVEEETADDGYVSSLEV